MQTKPAGHPPEITTKRRPKKAKVGADPLPPAADSQPARAVHHQARLDPLEWTFALADEHALAARQASADLWMSTMNRWRYDGPITAVRTYQETVGCDLEEARQIVEAWALKGGYAIDPGLDYNGAPEDHQGEPHELLPAGQVEPGWDDVDERANRAQAAAAAEEAERAAKEALLEAGRTRLQAEGQAEDDPMAAFEDAPSAATGGRAIYPPDPEAQPRHDAPHRRASDSADSVVDLHPTARRKVLGNKIEDVAYSLDQEEFRDRAQTLARIEEEISDEEKRQAQLKADMKAQITALSAKRSKLSLVVRDGREYRPTRLTIEADFEAGIVRELTTDGRVHKQRPLREDERQTSMFGRDHDEEAEP